MKSAATETREEIKNSALWMVFRAITVSRAAKIAAIENTQKKTASQPDKIIVDCRLPIADLKPLLIADFQYRSSSTYPTNTASSGNSQS